MKLTDKEKNIYAHLVDEQEKIKDTKAPDVRPTTGKQPDKSKEDEVDAEKADFSKFFGGSDPTTPDLTGAPSIEMPAISTVTADPNMVKGLSLLVKGNDLRKDQLNIAIKHIS